MNATTSPLRTVLTLLCALTVPMGLAAEGQSHTLPRYALTDLGTLGGTFSQAGGLNDEGAVAGFSTLPGDMEVHAFLWKNGVMTDLGTLGGPNSFTPEGYTLNDRKSVAGFSDTSTPDPNGESFCDETHLTCVPFVWRNEVMTPLPLLGGNNGLSFGINNPGQIIGVAENSTPDPTCVPPFFLQLRAAIWEKGHVQELPPFPGDSDAAAGGINDKGQVVGSSGDCTLPFGTAFHALLWENGMAVDLGNLGGTTGNIPSKINNRGQIVGQSARPDGFVHAFLWENGVMRDLGTLPGDVVSEGLGINENGQVVGLSFDANMNVRGFFWKNGVIADLNALIPADSPWFVLEALGINNRGQIAGYALNTSTGQVHGFLATPVKGNEDAAPVAQSRRSETPRVVLSEKVREMLRHQHRWPGLGK